MPNLGVNSAIRSWPDNDRREFWTFVRGRMAERRLNEDHVADRLHMSRSSLNRRLNGQIKEHPTEQVIEQLGEVLSLAPTEVRQLRRLAGYAQDAQPAGTMAVPAAPVPTSVSLRARLLSIRSAIVGLTAAGLATAMAFAMGVIGTKPVVPGGVWVEPEHNEVVAAPIHLAARAYPTNHADTAIAFVQFTVSWEGRPGPWMVACRLQSPVGADIYACDWNPAMEAEQVPPGQLHLSFDVYDERGNVNRAPHGVRTIIYKPGQT